MIKGILGKKLGMSQIFQEDGRVIPVTLIEAGPCFVLQKKIADVDGYEALQIGMEQKKADRVNKPEKGHQDKAGKGYFYETKEVECDDVTAVEVGDEIRVADVFAEGEKIKVSGTSKGKGFQGTVSRHGFGGLPASHGSKIHRATGSIGCSAYPARVIKGKRMPGHTGARNVTLRGLEVVSIDADQNIVAVKGAVPGPRGHYVLLKKQ